jgi:hypothetical protein
MATFGQLTITNAGLALLAKAQTGTAVQFTRLAIGDGELGATDPATLTALVNRLQWVTISSITRDGTDVTAAGTFNNQGAAEAFYFREIGLFAQDPQEGEILYAYGNAGETADEIPAEGSQVIERTVSITTVLSTEIALTVELVSGAYLLASEYTAEDILEKLKTVDGNGSGLDADMLEGYHGADTGSANKHVVLSTPDGTVKAYKLQVGGSTVIPRIYVQTADPGSVPDGSVWIKPKA